MLNKTYTALKCYYPVPMGTREYPRVPIWSIAHLEYCARKWHLASASASPTANLHTSRPLILRDPSAMHTLAHTHAVRAG